MFSKKYEFINNIVNININKIFNFSKNFINLLLYIKNEIYIFYNKY